MLDKVEWGEFRLSDLFEINTSRSIDKGKISCNDGEYEFVGRTATDNGVQGNVGYLGFEPNDKDTFSVIQIGENIAQFRSSKWYASQNIFVMKPKISKFVENNLFLISAINKALKAYSGGYSSYPTLEKLKMDRIKLPTKNNEIDFKFIEKFMDKLENERIKVLDTYLEVTGLKDCKLTIDEQNALDEFDKITWGEFAYNQIFNNIAQGRRLTKDDQLPGCIPFVMAGTTNTGIVGHISNPVAKFCKNSITIDIFGNTFYRNYDFGAGDDTGVYWNTQKLYSKETMLFYSTSMEKSVKNKFDFGKKLRSSQSHEFKMKIPISSKEPNYQLMNNIISAIRKLVIKDVVNYVKDKI